MLTNCKRCGALFLKKDKGDICDKCIGLEQELVKKIVKLVKRHQDEYVQLEEIAETLQVDISDLENLLVKGKLLQVADKIITKCKSCGIEVKGTERKNLFCNKCLKNF